MADETQESPADNTTSCGVCSLKGSACLTRFSTLRWYTAILSTVLLLTTALYSYLSAVMTTTQAVFSFSSQGIGYVNAMYEFGAALSTILASHFLASKNIPQVISISMLPIVISAVMVALPHFFIDYGNKVSQLGTSDSIDSKSIVPKTTCDYSSNSTSASDSTTGSSNPSQGSQSVLITYCVASLINGLGHGPISSLGPTFIDNNSGDDSSTSIRHNSVVQALSTLAPMVGIGLGGAVLYAYVNLQDTLLTPSDAEWIGAWWLGYFIFASLILILSPVMMQFPKKLPEEITADDEGSAVSMEGRDQELSPPRDTCHNADTESVDLSNADDGKHKQDKGCLVALRRLLANPVYVLLVIASTCITYPVTSWTALAPKYFEVQFSFSSPNANFMGGIAPPVFACSSLLIVRYVMSQNEYSLQAYTRYLFIITLLSALIILPLPFMGCQQYPSQPPPTNLSCADECGGCDTNLYSPVCYNNVTYMSACKSRCPDFYIDSGSIVYKECFCGQNITMSKGVCTDEGCHMGYAALTVIVVAAAVITSGVPIGTKLLMMCVDVKDKSLAVGLQSGISSLLGWIPAPIVFDTLLDSTCRIWEYPNGTANNPDWQGYCQEYDNVRYRTQSMALSIAMMGMGAVFTLGAWIASRRDRYLHISADGL